MAAILVAVSQLAVMYSQEIRPYSMALCLVAVAIYFYVVAVREQNVKAWCAFVVTVILMVYTNYFTALVAACLFTHCWLMRKRFSVQPGWLWWGASAMVAAFLPWLSSGVVYSALHSAKTLPQSQPSWFSADWLTFFRDLNSFNNGAINGALHPASRMSFAFGLLLFAVPVLLALKPLFRRAAVLEKWSNRDSALLLAMLWLVPHLILLGLAMRGMQYSNRYSLFCLVPYYVLVAGGLASLPRSVWRWSWLAAIVLYSGFALRAQYSVPYKEDYRGALRFVAARQEPGDCAIFMPYGGLPIQWDIYEQNHKPPDLIAPAALDSKASLCGRIWLVTESRVSSISDRAHLKEVEQKLGPLFFVKTEEKQYFWVDVALFARPNVAAGDNGEQTARKLQ